jgi:hypothetical protein
MLLHPKIIFAANTLEIDAIIKQGTFFSTNYYVQDNLNFTFGSSNPLCPNDCKYKFEDGDFSESLIGDNDMIFSGILKIEDKQILKQNSLHTLIIKCPV